MFFLGRSCFVSLTRADFRALQQAERRQTIELGDQATLSGDLLASQMAGSWRPNASVIS
jgi:hypothetical protein